MTVKFRFVLIFLASQWVVTEGNILSGITDAIIGKIPPPSPEDKELLRESEMNMAEICQKYGYVAEKYTVNTEDGYILDLYHLVREKNDSSTVNQVVLIMHGVIASSRFWFDTAENSLAFYLFDNGYDVWLGNTRGNFYTKHVKYTREQKEFWDYCLEDSATKDLPSTIDTILEKTGAKKVVYIGNSMGSAVGFAFLSAMVDYHPKVAGFIALSPITNIRYHTGFLRILLDNAKLITSVAKIAGIHNLLSLNPKERRIIQYLCPAKNPTLCAFVATLAAGYDPYIINGTKSFIYTSHLSEGVSTKLLEQFSQNYHKNGFYKFDYGPAKNLEVYHNETAPEYNLTEITVPVALVYGPNDALSDVFDVCVLIRKLPNIVGNKLVDFGLYNHADMMEAIDNKKFFYEDVNSYLEKMFA